MKIKAGITGLAVFTMASCSPVAGGEIPIIAGVQPGDASGRLFVANKRGDSLSLIDLETGTELKRVGSCSNPHELATSPDGKHVALACYAGTSVDIFRTSDLGKVASIELGENARPHGIVWHRNGDLYSTAEGRQSIFWIRNPLGKMETFEFSTGKQGSHMVVVSPDARHAWTTDLGSKTVTLVDMLTRRAPQSVTVGEEPEGIALSPDGQTLWVSARGSNKAFALDPMTLKVRHEIETGQFPLRIAVRPQGDFAVTSDLVDGGLTVIDTASAIAIQSITVGGDAERFQVTILWSSDGKRIYAAETATDTIAEIDFTSGEVLRRLPTGEGGDGLAILN